MYKLIFIYFLIGFVSDFILNYLSGQHYAPDSIKALRVYFQRQTIKNSIIRDLVSATYAGLTIVAAILPTMGLAQLIFKFTHPRSLPQLYRFLLVAFPVGYAMDVFIEKTEVFGPTLRPFYKIAGAGFWGAAAFLFSILIAYIALKSI
jgi:hypothetical protein